jgi:hypothetical protein
MKRIFVAILLGSVLALQAVPARAVSAPEDHYDDSIAHPLRVAAYLAHPIGFAAEWLVFRPFHYIISRPHLDRLFGYQPGVDRGLTFSDAEMSY